MSTRNRLALAGAAGLLLAVLPVYAKKAPKAPVQRAKIDNTGSTNTKGYTIEVSPDSSAQYSMYDPLIGAQLSGTQFDGKKVLPKAQVKALFHDLDAAIPLNALPVRHGMRSASFGTATYITYKGQRSPDLTFASDPRTAALKADIDAITKTLHVGNAPRRPIVIHADR